MSFLCSWAKRYGGIAFLVVVGLGGCASGVAASSLAPAVHVVSKLAWATNPSSADLSYIAQHDSLLITDGYPIANRDVAVLHAKHPGITVLPYINGLERTPDDHIYPGSCTAAMVDYECPAVDNVVNAHPDWFLHDASGSLVYDRSCGTHCFVMDPANPGWIAYRQAEVRWYIDAYGYDGVFFDQIWPTLALSSYDRAPIDPSTGTYYTAAQWTASVTTFLAAIKQALGSKLLIVNSIGDGSEYAANQSAEDPIVQIADGATEEGFIQWSNQTTPRSETEWRQDVDSIASVTSQGKLAIGWTDQATGQTAAQTSQVAMFSFASYLLGAGPSSQRYYVFQNYQPPAGAPPAGPDSCGDSQCQMADPVWTEALGDPVGAYYRSGDVFERKFTGGLVVVNPSTTTASQALDAPGITPGGQDVSSVTLPSQSATVLLTPGETPAAATPSTIATIATTNPMATMTTLFGADGYSRAVFASTRVFYWLGTSRRALSPASSRLRNREAMPRIARSSRRRSARGRRPGGRSGRHHQRHHELGKRRRGHRHRRGRSKPGRTHGRERHRRARPV